MQECVTTQKSEDLIYTAAKAWNLCIRPLADLKFPTNSFEYVTKITASIFVFETIFEPLCNDIGLCDTSFITSDGLRYVFVFRDAFFFAIFNTTYVRAGTSYVTSFPFIRSHRIYDEPEAFESLMLLLCPFCLDSANINGSSLCGKVAIPFLTLALNSGLVNHSKLQRKKSRRVLKFFPALLS